ncbi:hypothetical protein FKM82_027046 [Ascaphus truei]
MNWNLYMLQLLQETGVNSCGSKLGEGQRRRLMKPDILSAYWERLSAEDITPLNHSRGTYFTYSRTN